LQALLGYPTCRRL